MYHSALIFTTTLIVIVSLSLGRKPHIINFRSLNLYPESLTWDPQTNNFIVGSLRHPTLLSISQNSVVKTLISDTSLPPHSVFTGLTIDPHRQSILAVIHSLSNHPPSNSLSSYNLHSRQRLFLSPLHDPNSTNTATGANDIALDLSGNAYVTNSISNLIYKVTPQGQTSIFSNSPVFTQHPVHPNPPYNSCGLNGVVFIKEGYLLVVQSNTGKLFKVDADNGTATTVLLNKDLMGGDGVAVTSDGVVVVVSREKAYFIKTESCWKEGVVFDEIALDVDRFATSVAIGKGDRVYVLYGHIGEAIMGNVEREEFSIVEIESESESESEKGSVWVFGLIGLTLAYFMFWRFQMRQLVTVNKKTA